MKKLISTILTLALIFAVNTTAFASEEYKALPAAESVESTEVFLGNIDAVLIGSSEETRSTSLPTSYWSLAKKSYTADLQVVGKNWLYTNYYYHPTVTEKSTLITTLELNEHYNTLHRFI